MARGRMLGKRLSTSQRFARLFEICPDLAEFAQSLYPLLLAHSDDFGRQQGDVFTVRHQVHPTSPRSASDFERALQALHETELIVRYEAKGRRFIQIVQFDQHQSGLHKRTRSEFPAVPGRSGESPEDDEKTAEIPAQEKGREEKRTELKGTKDKRGADAPPPSVLVTLWNDLTTPPIPRCDELTPKRKARAQVRLKERAIEVWRAVIQRIQASSFCRGENERGWIASFDWLLQPDVSVKVLEGKYDDRANGKKRPRSLGPDYSKEIDWFEECKEIHGGKCSQRSHHENRMLIDADKKAVG